MLWIRYIKTFSNKLLNLFLYACLFVLILILLHIFCLTSFIIPTDSMEPTLFAGDRIIVNKLISGARVFNVIKSLNHEDFDIYRIPALGKIKRNDVLVFNFPYQHGWDSICFDVMKYYVKRCIALPGDTIEIVNGYFEIRGINQELGNVISQKRISNLDKNIADGIILSAFPQNDSINWTIQNFGPLALPCREQVVELNYVTTLLYRNLITWEQKKKVSLNNGKVFIGDSLVFKYQFRENYYFVAGDRAENSQDSRYWGLLPEPFIVGKATWVWKSIDPVTGTIRKDRILTRIR